MLRCFHFSWSQHHTYLYLLPVRVRTSEIDIFKRKEIFERHLKRNTLPITQYITFNINIFPEYVYFIKCFLTNGIFFSEQNKFGMSFNKNCNCCFAYYEFHRNTVKECFTLVSHEENVLRAVLHFSVRLFPEIKNTTITRKGKLKDEMIVITSMKINRLFLPETEPSDISLSLDSFVKC